MEKLVEICRVCLEADHEDMHKIFDECLNNKIIIMTGLDLLPSDSLPKKICKNCRYQLEQSYYFRLLAKQSDTRLRKYTRLVNQKKKKEAEFILSKDYKDDDIEELDEHMNESNKYFDNVKLQILTEKQKVLEEELQQLKTRSNTSSRKPLSPFKPSNKPFVLLNKVAETSSSSSTVTTLRRKEKSELIEEIEVCEIQLVDNDEGRYEIEILEADCADEGEVQVIEMAEKVDEKFEAKEIKKLPRIKKTIEKKPQPDQNHANDYCRVIPEGTKVELDAAGEKKIFRCGYSNCEVTFSRRQQCKTHYYNHLAKNSLFSCNVCSKKFKTASALERHVRVHTNSKPFICDICDKGFSQKEMLKRHHSIHLPKQEAPYECNICSERFRQRDPLKQHVKKVHCGNVASFSCSLCEKSFSHSSGLSRHLLVHSGKNFTCKSCARSFTDKSALKRHEKIHTKSTKVSKKKGADDEMEFFE